MRIFKSIFTIGSMTLISRILGFVRDTLIAIFLGAGIIADAFLIAQRFPNLFRKLFAEGTMQSAFVPIFAGLLAEKNQEEAKKFANQVFTLVVLIISIFVIVVEVFARQIVMFSLPGFMNNNEILDLVTLFVRINFPYLLFISLVSFYSGILNSLYKFAMVAFTPAILNIVTIVFLLFNSHFITAGHAASWSVLFAGISQWLFLLYACYKCGWLTKFVSIKKLVPEVSLLFKRLIPITLGAGVYQVNTLIDMILLSFLPQSSPTYLYLADRLAQLPLALIGIAVGTVILPILTKYIKSGNELAANQIQEDAILYALLLAIPAGIGLLILAQPIIFVLFEHGKFIDINTRATAYTLMAYSIGVPSASVVKVLTPGFYARGDTKTPFYITIASLFIYLIFVLVLMSWYSHVGLALATSIAAIFNMLIMMYILYVRKHLKFSNHFLKEISKAIIAALIMAIFIGALQPFLRMLMLKSMLLTTLGLFVLLIFAVIVWLVTLYFLKSVAIVQFKRIFKRSAK